MSLSANDCVNCAKLTDVLADQKKKMSLIEVRLRDLVNAYKKVCSERDNLLAIRSATVQPLSDLHEQQKRLSSLEASVTEMSAICGQYELQSVKDKQLIQELSQQCEQLSNKLTANETTHQKTNKESNKTNKTFRQRGVQTDEWFEINDVTNNEAINVTEKVVKNIETQTETQSEFDVFGVGGRKRSELAVVLPTLSETQPQTDCDDSEDADRLSVERHDSPINSLDNYPVFETMTTTASMVETGRQSGDLFGATATTTGVSLFYANELARKEIDLAETRIQAREQECALREWKWKYNTEIYRLQSRVNDLERNLSQTVSNQPLSQLNVTYIRNVLMKLLNTKDKHQKQFMINAILTALEPNPNDRPKDRKPK